MRFPALAIGWELWGRNRAGLVAVAAGLLVCCTTAVLLPNETAAETVLRLSVIAFPIALLYLLSVVLYCEFHEGTFRLGIPARMFTLPVRTPALVAWLMLYGLAALTALWLAASALVWLPAGVEPAWWLLPLLAVAVAWFQAVCWAVPGPPLAKVVAACVVFPALKFALEMIALAVVLFVYHEPRADREAVLRARPVILTIFTACFLPLAYAVAVAGVSRARCGANGGWSWLRQGVEGALSRLPRRRAPFRSPAAAQLWLEWRRKGVVLPLCPIGFLLFLTLVVAPFVPTGELVGVTLGMAVLLVAVAFFVGYGFGKTNFWAGDFRLPAFHATRPVGSGALASAKLGAAALSALVTCAVVVLGVPLWLWLLGRSGEAAGWVAVRLQGFDSLQLGALAALGVVGLFTLTWGQLVGGMVPALTGRPWVVNAVVAAYLALAAALGLLARHVYDHPAALGSSVAVLCAAAWALSGVKLLAAWFALHAARRRWLVTWQAVAAAVAAWATGVGCLFTLAHWLLPAPARPLTVAVVLLVPLARLAAAPLALAWNRHR